MGQSPAKNQARGRSAKMIPEMGHCNSRIVFGIWPHRAAAVCPQFPQNRRKITGNPPVSENGPLRYLVSNKNGAFEIPPKCREIAGNQSVAENGPRAEDNRE